MSLTFTRPRRKFDPSRSARYGLPSPFPMDRLVKYSPKWQFSRIFNFPFSGSIWRPRMNTLVLQVQGIAEPNDRNNPNSKAAYGVSFGRDCPHNTSGALHPSESPTANRALIEGVLQALMSVAARRVSGDFDHRWKEIIIMLNSEYVANTLSKWVWKWEDEDWRCRSNGQRIHNLPSIRSLHQFITHLETDLNFSVRFWKVDRHDIVEADDLAKAALA